MKIEQKIKALEDILTEIKDMWYDVTYNSVASIQEQIEKISKTNRDIRFRAWWAYGFNKEATPNMIMNWESSREMEDVWFNWWGYFKIMQYTWLKDKNWKKIYEWDIIKVWLWDDDYWLKVIEFDRGIFWYNNKLTTLHPLWCVLESIVEIIWNIYEDKDLINKNKWH